MIKIDKKPRSREELRTISLQLKIRNIEGVDEAATKAGLSRQKMIDLILDKVLWNKDFTLTIDE